MGHRQFPDSVWAAGAAGGTSVLHWNGTSRTPETIPSGPNGPPTMTGINAVRGSATEVWAAGTFVVHHPCPVTGLTAGAGHVTTTCPARPAGVRAGSTSPVHAGRGGGIGAWPLAPGGPLPG